MPLRVAIAEDSVILRDGLVQLLLDRGFEVTAAVGRCQCAPPRSIEQELPGRGGGGHPDAARRSPTRGSGRPSSSAGSIEGLAILMFSQYIETRYAEELLGNDAAGIGYLLKDRVADVSQFVEALIRVASGGTALDPEVVTQLMGASRHRDSISLLTTREKDVLSLMAEGRTNAAIADSLCISEGAVEKHVDQHLLQVRPARLPVGPPTGPGGPALPRHLTTHAPARREPDRPAAWGWRDPPDRGLSPPPFTR